MLGILASWVAVTFIFGLPSILVGVAAARISHRYSLCIAAPVLCSAFVGYVTADPHGHSWPIVLYVSLVLIFPPTLLAASVGFWLGDMHLASPPRRDEGLGIGT